MGSAEGRSPFAGGLGVSPIFNFLLGGAGNENWSFNTLLAISFQLSMINN